MRYGLILSRIFLFLHRENEGMGALGTELSSEALTLRVFRVSKNRETMRETILTGPHASVYKCMAHLDVSLYG